MSEGSNGNVHPVWPLCVNEQGPLKFKRRYFNLLALAGAAALAGLPGTSNASSTQDESYKRVEGLGVYFGILPAAMVRGHAKAHPEASMHGGVPQGIHEYHILVAVFDDATGTRIDNAKVTATVSPLGHVGQWSLTLDPMTIAGTITYGNFVDLPGNDRYDFRFNISMPGRKAPVSADFAYQHEP